MIGLLLKFGLALLPKALPVILGWFGISINDERDKEREAGEKLGRAETEAAVATRELDKAQRAATAGNDAIAADAGGLRDPHPGDRKWDPDVLG